MLRFTEPITIHGHRIEKGTSLAEARRDVAISDKRADLMVAGGILAEADDGPAPTRKQKPTPKPKAKPTAGAASATA